MKSKVRRQKHIRRQPSLPPKAEEPPTSKQSYRILITLLTFTIVFIALDVVSYSRKSATWDEPVHVTAGYAALARHDYRVDPEHPPFLRIWAALPLLLLDGIELDTAIIDDTHPTRWAVTDLFAFCRQFMYLDNDADRLLYSARFMVVLLGVALGVLVFCWVNEWLGYWPAVVVVTLYSIEPNIAAHSSLVTTDFGITCFVFGTVYFLWRTCRQPSPLNVTGLAGSFSLAVISKYSALILGIIVPLLLALACLRFRSLKRTTALWILALLLSAALVAIWGSYAFRYAPSTSDDWLFRFQNVRQVQQRVPGLASVVEWIDSRRLLPNAFTQGFLLGQAKSKERSAFLMGSYSRHGWWYYFPVAFLIKTPVAVILLFFAGAVVWLRQRRQRSLQDVAFVALPIMVFLVPAMASTMNIGLRHILPIYPFVLVLAGAAVKELIHRSRKGGGVVLGILMALALLEFGSVYPHNLTFFNRFIGGPRNGIKYLVDSNLDWGQDLKPLKRWMERNDVGHINLAYFGMSDPRYYDIDYTYLPGSFLFAGESIQEPTLPGYVAVSATILSGVYFDEHGRSIYAPLRDREPLTRIGNSIHVYWLENQ